MARALREARQQDAALCVLGGGEPTCEVRGTGRGGRNQELAAVAGLALSAEVSRATGDEAAPRVLVLSAGTDGQDGVCLPCDAAAPPGPTHAHL